MGRLDLVSEFGESLAFYFLREDGCCYPQVTLDGPEGTSATLHGQHMNEEEIEELGLGLLKYVAKIRGGKETFAEQGYQEEKKDDMPKQNLYTVEYIFEHGFMHSTASADVMAASETEAAGKVEKHTPQGTVFRLVRVRRKEAQG